MTTRPLLLDLFCGAGGCSVGYHRAGFDVVGVDLKPQPRYPFPLLRADALGALRWLLLGGPIAFSDGRERRLADVAAVHASPPCQAFSSISRVFGVQHLHPDLVAPTRELLRAAGRPWVMENVPRSPLANPVRIRGDLFGLGVIRERWFETSFPVDQPAFPAKKPRIGEGYFTVTGKPGGNNCKKSGGRQVSGGSTAEWRRAMGVDWMTAAELPQAIPPAYTEWVGARLMAAVKGEV